jgi:hypothetical protein
MSTASLNETLDPLDLFGAQAGRQAADIQTQMADMGLQLERDFFNQLREDEAPVRDVRNQALDFLQGIQSGTESLTADPSLGFRTENAVRDIGTSAAAAGKFNSGGRLVAEQDASAQLASQDTGSQINRLLNLSGFETGDLLANNQLIAANTDSQANQMQNLAAIDQSRGVGRSNRLFGGLGQVSQIAGQFIRDGRDRDRNQGGGQIAGQYVQGQNQNQQFA